MGFFGAGSSASQSIPRDGIHYVATPERIGVGMPVSLAELEGLHVSGGATLPQQQLWFFELVAGLGEALTMLRFEGAVMNVSVRSAQPLIVSVTFLDDGVRTVVLNVDDWVAGTDPAPTMRQVGFDLGLQQIVEPGEWEQRAGVQLSNASTATHGSTEARWFRFVGDVSGVLGPTDPA